MDWIRALILVCALIGVVAAQERFAQKPAVQSLQLGTPIERTIAPGQSHTYQVVAEENSLVQITVEQRGIDVVVRVTHPTGKKPAEYDSPNGDDGPENVSFVTAGKNPYFIEVTPLGREPGPAGKYEIRLIELRQATEQEIKESKGQELLKARGLALLNEIEGIIAEVRLPQTRVKAQMQAALLLWDSDEKRALKYFTDATIGFKELIANVDANSREYTKNYHVIQSMRFEMVHALTSRQPELALSFLRSSPPLADPYGNQRDLAANEAAMEMQIAHHIAAKDPKRTLEIARENLKKGYSSALTNTIGTLRRQNPEMAAELATEAANKLLGEKITRDSQAAALVVGLIQLSRSQGGNQDGETNGSPRRIPLLADQLRRELLQKAINEAMAFKTSNALTYSPERDYTWNLLHGLQQLGPEVDTVMDGTAAAVNKKLNELTTVNSSLGPLQRFHDALNNSNMPIDEVIQVLSKAPKDQQDQLFSTLANRVQNSGDPARARQIVNEYITGPYQRQQALTNIETQEIYAAMAKGKIEEALRNVANLSTPQERAQALTNLANQIGPGYKRATALLFLDQARGLLSGSPQAQDQTQMQALLEIAKAFSRYDSKRAFEIVDPLIDQFNDISAAARTMEGFGGEYYEQEELILQNGNVIANVANQLSSALGTLALTNFDRARLTADRLRLPEVRLRAYLEIAQQAIQSAR